MDFMAPASLGGDLKTGQVYCQIHGNQRSVDSEGNDANIGICRQCLVEQATKEFVPCREHGLQPPVGKDRRCAVCVELGLRLEADGPPPPAAEGVDDEELRRLLRGDGLDDGDGLLAGEGAGPAEPDGGTDG